MIETTTERFETARPDEGPLVLESTLFVSEGVHGLSAGENPSMVIDQISITEAGPIGTGSVDLFAGDRMIAMLTLREDELERLTRWLDEHADDEDVTVYSSVMEQLEQLEDEDE